jgi:hypothetical protein
MPILLASFRFVILQNTRGDSKTQDENTLCNSNVKLGEMNYGQYSAAEEAEQAGAERISQQAARKLVRGITRDAQRTEWESL